MVCFLQHEERKISIRPSSVHERMNSMRASVFPFILLYFCCSIPAWTADSLQLANVSPVSVDFGEVRIGKKVTLPVTLKNLSGKDLNYSGFGIASTQGFSTDSGTCSSPLAPGTSCAFNLKYAPRNTTFGIVSESVNLVLAVQGGKTQVVNISMTGGVGGTLVHMGPREIDFGNVLLGETATVKVFRTNLNDQTVSFSGGGITVENGFSEKNETCSGTTLAAGASCARSYSFTPGKLGLHEDLVSICAVIPSQTIGECYGIQLKGTGVNTVAQVASYPVSFDFGDVTFGSITDVEISHENLTGGTVTVSGGGASFPFVGTSITGPAGCAANAIPAGTTCTSSFRFTPQTLGLAEETASRNFVGLSSQQVQYSMSGTGVGTFGEVWPLKIDFGRVRTDTSMSVPVTVTNTTRAPLTGFLGGGALAPFASSNNCPSSLPVGSSCQYIFTFTASAFFTGPRSAQTSISFTNIDGPRPFYLIELTADANDDLFADQFESN